MKYVRTVPIAPRDPSGFADVLGPAAWASFCDALRRPRLRGHTVWNVNTTAAGGGVAEMLQSLVAYARGVGADVRWAVITPPPGIGEFFAVTKRIHNMLHGYPGDGLGLDRTAREVYRAALEPNALELAAMARPGDVMILHDPQTAGLVPAMRAAGLSVIWRCHVGADDPNGEAHEVWDFLRPFVEQADRYVFSRRAHVWEHLNPVRTLIVPPSIDAFSPKNQDLPGNQVEAILKAVGAIAGAPSEAPIFRRAGGSTGRVERPVQMLGSPTIDPAAPLVTQVSRWDMLKDPLGVMAGFVHHVLPAVPQAQLALVGPETATVADDPEGAQVLADCQEAWRAYPAPVRERVALVCVPMTDLEENAAIVNAVQRHSRVIVQKSLAEGFGLTVSEAMWKSRPVIASRIGGIADQIVDGDSGVLIRDPTDLQEFGNAVATILQRPTVAESLGRRARQRVTNCFLATRSLMQYADGIAALRLETAPPIAA
jgi:trehalose synthase